MLLAWNSSSTWWSCICKKREKNTL